MNLEAGMQPMYPMFAAQFDQQLGCIGNATQTFELGRGWVVDVDIDFAFGQSRMKSTI